MQFEVTGSRSVLQFVSKYLSFLHYAQTPSGHFHNFMSYDQMWLDNQSSEDCFGRVLWACGYALKGDLHPNIKKVAKQLFDNAARWINVNQTIRGRAYMGTGCYFYLQAYPDAQIIRQGLITCAESLVEYLEKNEKPDWCWFEDMLTYSNGIIPRMLFLAYMETGDKRYLDAAERSLDFLTSVCVKDGILYPIGCNGWYFRGSEKAIYDQQPVDPMAHTICYLTAFDATNNKKYLELAKISFDWFFGKNSVGEPLYDPTTGGCFDALAPEGPNFNQGAESTISCLLAQLAMLPYTKLVEELK